MSSSPHETDPLLPRAAAASRKATFLWLVPVVALASICRGISMFARFEHYQRTFCPEATYPCGYWTVWLELPSITAVKWESSNAVMMEAWMFGSFVVSFISVGWWSELGDRKGRKIVLLFSILGAVVVDLFYLLAANTSPSQDDARDMMSLGLIIEGLLGGFATYSGAVHAYAFDVASTPLSRPILFGGIEGLSLVGFIVGAVIGKFTRYNISFVLGVVIALGNLAFIYALLPESLKERDGRTPSIPQRSIVKSIVSPFSVFYRGAGSSKYLPHFALAFYVYSLTSAMDTSLIQSTSWGPFLPALPRWILVIIPRVLSLTTLFAILPGIAWSFERKHGTSESAGFRLATTLSQNSILLAAISCVGVITFCLPDHALFLYSIFTPMYPIAAAVATPALYALGAAYFVALGRASEIGSLFGAMAIWGALAQFISYAMYNPQGPGTYIFWLSAFFLVVALMLLLRDPPPVEEEEVVHTNSDDV